MKIAEYIKKKLAEGDTDFDINLSLAADGELFVDPDGIHNLKFNVESKK